MAVHNILVNLECIEMIFTKKILRLKIMINSNMNFIPFSGHALLPCSTENYTLTCITWETVAWRVTFWVRSLILFFEGWPCCFKRPRYANFHQVVWISSKKFIILAINRRKITMSHFILLNCFFDRIQLVSIIYQHMVNLFYVPL